MAFFVQKTQNEKIYLTWNQRLANMHDEIKHLHYRLLPVTPDRLGKEPIFPALNRPEKRPQNRLYLRFRNSLDPS